MYCDLIAILQLPGTSGTAGTLMVTPSEEKRTGPLWLRVRWLPTRTPFVVTSKKMDGAAVATAVAGAAAAPVTGAAAAVAAGAPAAVAAEDGAAAEAIEDGTFAVTGTVEEEVAASVFFAAAGF